MAAVLRRMRGPPGALDGTGSSKAAGWGSDRERISAAQKHSDGQIKNEATFFIVYNNPIHKF